MPLDVIFNDTYVFTSFLMWSSNFSERILETIFIFSRPTIPLRNHSNDGLYFFICGAHINSNQQTDHTDVRFVQIPGIVVSKTDQSQFRKIWALQVNSKKGLELILSTLTSGDDYQKIQIMAKLKIKKPDD